MLMSDTFKQCLFLLLGGIVHFHFMLLPTHAQDDQLGFISIDCGFFKSASYIEKTTKLKYISDAEFVDTGETRSILNQYRDMYQQPYGPLRSFPEGDRNCYKINVTRGAKYLIRTSFIYGNYDGQNKLPEFELHLGPDLWDTVKLDGVSIITHKELIHIPPRNYVHICLVNTANGVPFISAIELRPLPNGTYQTQTGSLALTWRFDTGVLGLNNIVAYRYPLDVHDRFWAGYKMEYNWAQLYTLSAIISGENMYQLPSVVMSTASTPKDGQSTLYIGWMPLENVVETEYLVCMHFAEVEQLQPNESRQMYITWNGQLLVNQFSPYYLATSTFCISKTVGEGGRYDLSIVKAATSTLPPILNAIEIYTVKKFLQSETNQEDIKAITNIKSTYKIKKNWQGDPCSPEVYLWEGLKCSYKENESPRIISLDLSSSVLTGEIAPSISKLAMIQTLDLSNNNLTGSIPGSLSQLQNLNVLNLEKNKLTGSVPERLNDRRKNGSLSLSLCENPNLSGQVSCKKKKKNIGLRIVLPLTIGALIVFFLVATAIWWLFSKSKVPPEAQEAGVSFVSAQRRIFTASEIRPIINNSTMIGQGGYGVVYHSLLDGKEVAVKILHPSASTESLNTFTTEATILMNVNHRNVVSLIGYCAEVGAVALIYQYLPKGNLRQQLLAAPHPSPVVSRAASPHDRLLNNNARSSQLLNGQSVSSQLELNSATAYHTAQDGFLKWKERLIIAIDIARGLEYLHTDYNPPIVHRDIKSANILLTKNLRAKIGDFGIAKIFASESSTHATTRPIGTDGYVDPEYVRTHILTKKSDVYSFGIVLLELITGKDPRRFDIADWVHRQVDSGDIGNIVDPNLEGRYKNSSAQKAIDTALECSLPESNGRPEIADVYKVLKECLRLENSEERTVENNGPTSLGWRRFLPSFV